jgi:hypothetical protein
MVGGIEKARKALQLRLVVLRAALDDHLARGFAANDVLRLEARGAQHAHGMVMRQHHVLDRLVGDGADVLDDLVRHLGRRLRIDHQHCVVADHDPGIGIALGSEGVSMLRQAAEGDLLLRQIRL